MLGGCTPHRRPLKPLRLDAAQAAGVRLPPASACSTRSVDEILDMVKHGLKGGKFLTPVQVRRTSALRRRRQRGGSTG